MERVPGPRFIGQGSDDGYDDEEQNELHLNITYSSLGNPHFLLLLPTKMGSRYRVKSIVRSPLITLKI